MCHAVHLSDLLIAPWFDKHVSNNMKHVSQTYGLVLFLSPSIIIFLRGKRDSRRLLSNIFYVNILWEKRKPLNSPTVCICLTTRNGIERFFPNSQKWEDPDIMDKSPNNMKLRSQTKNVSEDGFYIICIVLYLIKEFFFLSWR